MEGKSVKVLTLFRKQMARQGGEHVLCLPPEGATMKVCSRCRKAKPLSEFGIKRRRNQVERQSYCRECNKESCKEHYQGHKKEYKEKSQHYRKKMREFVRNLKTIKGCSVCKKEFDPKALDFVHRDGTDKIAGISEIVSDGRSLKLLKAELRKCDVICSNCRRKT